MISLVECTIAQRVLQRIHSWSVNSLSNIVSIIFLSLEQSLNYLFILLSAKGWLIFKSKLSTTNRVVSVSSVISYFIVLFVCRYISCNQCLYVVIYSPLTKPMYLFSTVFGYLMVIVQYYSKTNFRLSFGTYIWYCCYNTYQLFCSDRNNFLIVLYAIFGLYIYYPFIFTFWFVYSDIGHIQIIIEIVDNTVLLFFKTIIISFFNPSLSKYSIENIIRNSFIKMSPYFSKQLSNNIPLKIQKSMASKECQSIVKTSYAKFLQIKRILKKVKDSLIIDEANQP